MNMIRQIGRCVILFFIIFINGVSLKAQCVGGITGFPYTENFELNDGGWVSGGFGNDWAWGIPNKPVITGAASGAKCWITGGLTGSSYTASEASYLVSPCFDFTGVQYPYIEFKVFWETEQHFDGGSFQYSLDNGASWSNVGAAGDPVNCLNANWFNFSPINYLSPLSGVRDGWSGNKQTTSGGCNGGNGSNGWLQAKHTMPYLGGKSGVIFRFIFGAGTICNAFDGFAIDDIKISEALPNVASFTYNCINNNTVSFTNTSILCPSSYDWNFGDPASGVDNTDNTANATHTFSAPGKYTVSLTVSGPGNAPSTITKDIYIISANVTQLQSVDCQTNTGGSLMVSVDGATGASLNLLWNTVPSQSGSVISNLTEGIYSVQISGTDVCPITATGKAEKDISCIGIFFPSAFTPDGDGKNDVFGPLGSLLSLTNYQLSIYNRWGERVFFSTNPFEKWNGNVKGMKTDGNIFVWQSSFSINGQTVQKRKGTILLIR